MSSVKVVEYIEKPLSSLNKFETVSSDRMVGEACRFYRFTDERDTLRETVLRIAELCESDYVLDIGSGDGATLQEISKVVRKCVAIEPNPHMFSLLSERFKNDARVLCYQTGLEEFETFEKLNIVLSIHTLSFFMDKDRMIEKMINLAGGRGSNGKVIIVLHSRSGEQFRILNDVYFRVYGEKLNHVSAEALCSYLQNRGLGAQLEKVKTTILFPSFESVMRIGYFLFRVRYEKANHKIRSIIRSVLERYNCGKGIKISTCHGIVSLSL